MKRRFQARERDPLPSLDDMRAAMSSKRDYERVVGPLMRDNLVDYFRELIELGVGDALRIETVSRGTEGPGSEESVEASEPSVVVPIWMLAQAVVLLKDAPPGRKQFRSWKEQRLRHAGKQLYRRKQKDGKSAATAAEYVSHWLRARGVYLAPTCIQHGKL